MLANRTAIVTGSVDGLGWTIAEGLAAAGCRVVLNGLCEEADGHKAARWLTESHGVEALFDPADLRDVGAIERMAAAAEQRFGTVDIIVNNAVVRHFSPIEGFTAKQWEESLAVNLSAAFHLVRVCLPGMRARGWGRIVNLSSIYGSRGASDRVDYVTTKTALIGLTRAVAIETAESGITCNAICPGTVPSPAITQRILGAAEALGTSQAEAERDYLASRQPTRRFVAAENVAALVGFLCGPAGQDITGAVLPIDGGWSAA